MEERGKHQVAFWRPDARLRPYVSGYHRYVAAPAAGERLDDVFYPAWTSLRFAIDCAGPWSVRIGRRMFEPVPDDALFGATSHAGYVSAPRGTIVGASLTPFGWARLIGGDAAAFAGRIVPLDTIVRDSAALGDAVREADDPSAAFDAYLLDRLAWRPEVDPAIATIFDHLADPTVDRADALAALVGVTPRTLLRLSRIHFGFTPKLLLRRARFLRALMLALEADRGHWRDAAHAAGYWDGSHFLRDCHLFLDRTLGAFAALEKPINRESKRVRQAMLGAPIRTARLP